LHWATIFDAKIQIRIFSYCDGTEVTFSAKIQIISFYKLLHKIKVVFGAQIQTHNLVKKSVVFGAKIQTHNLVKKICNFWRNNSKKNLFTIFMSHYKNSYFTQWALKSFAKGVSR